MRFFFTILIILFWFNHSLGQISNDFGFTYLGDSVDTIIRIDTIELETQIIDLEIKEDSVYVYKIDIVRNLRCLLIGCATDHYEAIEYRELYIIRDNRLLFIQKEYPEFREKVYKLRSRW